ncbi:MAG: DUF6629 family protein [Actinomycetota bacterium]
MCFSPEADLVSGTLIVAVGVDALRHSRRRRDLPLVSLALLLGAHQLVETFVWWAADGTVGPELGRSATLAYLWFAFLVLPVLVPLAVAAMEPTRRRRWAMAPFVVVGTVVAVVLGVAMHEGPIVVQAAPYHLAYDVGHIPPGGFVVAGYLLATCGALLLSGYRHVVWFGLVNLPAALVIAGLVPQGFASVWCAWAAVSAAAIAVHIRVVHAGHAERAALARG